MVWPDLGKLVTQNQGLLRTKIAQCLLSLTASEQELGEDSIHLYRCVPQRRLITSLLGRPHSAGQGNAGSGGR